MPSAMIQALDEVGNVVDSSYESHLNDDDHKKMFEAMIKVRLFEERCMNLQRQGRIGFYIGAYGQEASHVATGYAFRQEDWIIPSYRELGIVFLRGIGPDQVFHQMFGNAKDHTRGAQMPCHYSFRDQNFLSISSPIATQMPHAVGIAMAAQYKNDKVVTGAYIGDGGTSEGDFHVAMNFAGLYKAPCVLIVENNQWAISCPSHRQTASEDYAIKAQAYGFEGIKVDGNDPLALYGVTHKAVEKARSGGGPTLIESYTYRLFSHSSSDDNSRYHDQKEYDAALKREPLIRYRKYLEGRGIWNAAYEEELSRQFKEEISQAVDAAEKTPRPDPASLFDHLYAQRPDYLEKQRQSLAEEMAERKRLNIEGEAEGAFPL